MVHAAKCSTHPALAAAVLSFLPICLLCAQPAGTASHIVVNPGVRHQVIEGFGLNYTGPYFRDDQKDMFDMLIKDLGASMFRVVVYFVYSDWEVVNDNDDPNSANWEYYNERYSNAIFEASWKGLRFLNSRGIRPVLALMGPVPPWMAEETSPPPRHSVCQKAAATGRLKPAMYDEFAETVVTMAVYARSKAGIDFEYFSPFNETDCYPPEGPRVDPEDAPNVLAAVARRMQKEGLGDVKLAVADQALITTDYIGPILKNKELMKQVGAFTLHTYGENSVGPGVETVKKSDYAHVPVWLTEYGDLHDLDRTAENDWKRYSLAANRRALTALNQGASALFFFNAFDDYEECARRLTYYGLFRSADHLYAPKKRYYATKQLYRFVAPGSQRISASTEVQGLTVSAFRDGAVGSLTIVGVKEGGPNRIRISFSSSPQLPKTWELYLTTRDLNCRKMDTLAPTGEFLEFDLPDEAVFTLVGRIGGG